MAIKFLNTVAVDTDVLYVDASSNNVGIGTTSPNAKLDIQGTQGQLFSVTDDLSGSIFAVSDISGVPIFDVNSSGVSYFDGNVGIGTKSPQAKLQINNGNLYFKNDSYGDNNRIGFGNPARNGDAGYIDYIGHGNFTGHIAFGLVTTSSNVAASEVARFNNQGNFGIGTTSPGAKLDVKDGNSAMRFQEYSNGASLFLDGSDGDFIGGDYFNISAYGATDLAFGYGAATKMVMKSTGSVGIGTTSPSEKLDVRDGTITSRDSGNVNYAELDRFSGLTLKGNGAGAKYISTPNTDALAFSTNSSERMRILSGGNVGIGTTSPDSTLHVLGPNAASGGITLSSSDSNNTQKVGRIKTSHYSNSEEPFTAILTNAQTSNNVLRLGGGSGGENAATEILFYTAANNTTLTGSERMRIDSNGNVGIGTTSPGQKLEVIGRTKITQSGDALRINSSDANGSYATWQNNGSNIGYIGAGYHLWSSPNNIATSLGIRAQTRLDLGIQASVHMTILNTGNVGIGTNNPSAKLQVAGTTTYNSDSAQALRVCDSTDVSKGIHIGFDTTLDKGIIQSGDFGVAYKGLLLNPNSGNVGIGTTSPNNKLDVNGDVFINSNYTANVAAQDLTIGKTTTGNHGLTIVTGPTYTGSIYFGDSGNNDAGIIKYQHGNNSMQFVTNRSEAMRIDSSGNVGIGTTNPSEKLEVAGNTRITGDVTLSNGNALRWTSDDVRIEGTTAGDNIKFYVANTEILQLAQSGTLATVTGNLRVTGAYYDSNNSPGTSGQVLSSTATGTDWVSLSEISGVDGTGTANYVAKWSDSDTITDSVIYDDGTNVGIGTSSPGHKLTVEGNIELGTGGYIYGDTNSPSVRLNSLQGSYLQYGTSSWVSVGYNVVTFRTSSSERMRINSSGNVGIGTTSPGFLLDVAGITNTSTLYVNNVDQNAVSRYGNLRSEVGFTRSPVTGNPNQWFKVVELNGSPKRIKLSIIAAGDNTNSYDNFLISTSGYGMHMHIEKLPGGKYNTSKLLSVAAVNPNNGGDVEIWIKLLPVYSGTGITYVACTSDVLASATILASATTIAPTLTPNDTQLDISNDNRLYATLQASRGATFGAKVGIGTNSPAAMLTVEGGDATISGNVGIGTTSPGSRRLNVVTSSSGTDVGIESKILRTSGTNYSFLGFASGSGATQNIGGFFSATGATTNTALWAYDGKVLLATQSTTDYVGIGTTSPAAKLDVAGNIKIQAALLSNQDNTDVDTGAEVVAQVAHATYTAAFFDFVVKKGTNVRSGTVYACHNGDTTPLVEFTETSTQDLGDTSDVTLSVDISGANMRLLATVTSDDWSVKSLIRAI